MLKQRYLLENQPTVFLPALLENQPIVIQPAVIANSTSYSSNINNSNNNDNNNQSQLKKKTVVLDLKKGGIVTAGDTRPTTGPAGISK